jgi:phosphatidylglycerol lysyltransferase
MEALLKSIDPYAVEPAQDAAEPAQVIDHPSGYLALSPKNSRYTVAGLSGFIAYRERGKHLILMGGVHAPAKFRYQLLQGFLAEAEGRRRRVVAVQVREDQTKLFCDCGFTVNQLGSSYGITLARFSLAGARNMKLRHKIKRAREAGLRVLEAGWELPRNQALFTQLEVVSEAWLRSKGKKELDFMVGEVGDTSDTERRIFVVVDEQEKIVGFITYVPAWGERLGYLHDLTRRLPDAPAGAMELCNSFAIERFIAERTPYLHFGFTPFIVDDGPRIFENRLVAFVMRMFGRFGGAIYPAQSQVSYKLKWRPDIVEREFIACRPLSIRALIDLLVLTQSV